MHMVSQAASLGATDLGVRAADERVARDEVRDDALAPRFGTLAIVKAHHQLPEVALRAAFEILEHASRRLWLQWEQRGKLHGTSAR